MYYIYGGTMTIFEMLGQSGVLILLGMGIVFGFLLILVTVISQFGRFFKSRHSGNGTVAQAGPAGKANEAGVIAAISAAIAEHRKLK